MDVIAVSAILLGKSAGIESYPDRVQLQTLAIILGQLSEDNLKHLQNALEGKGDEGKKGKRGGTVKSTATMAAELEV